VSREDLIQIEGVVREVMAGGQFHIESEKGQHFFAKISGRRRRFHIRAFQASASPSPSHRTIPRTG